MKELHSFLFSLLAIIFLAVPSAVQASTFWQPQPGWEIERVSKNLIDESGNGNSLEGILSGDGQYSVFTSRATNLVPTGDNNPTTQDVILHNRITDLNEFVNVGWDGHQATGDSWADAISNDGRYVIFGNQGDNTLVGPPDGHTYSVEIYLRDRQAGTTELLSGNNGVPGGGYSVTASMSDNQRYIVFYTDANNLIPGGKGAADYDVVMLDRSTGQFELISKRNDGERFDRSSATGERTMSSDGRYIVFYTIGDDPNNGDTNGSVDIYLRDRIAGTTTWVNQSISPDYFDCHSPSITPNGRFIVYICSHNQAGIPEAFVTDMTTNTTIMASLNEDGDPAVGGVHNPAISPDGRYVSFLWTGYPPLSHVQQGIRDLHTNHTALLTQTPDGMNVTEGRTSSAFSADSKWVIFDGKGVDLASSESSQVYVRPLPFSTATITPTPTPTATPTPTPTPQPVTVTFTSSGDSYIRDGEENRNSGAGEFMRIRSTGNNRALLKFNHDDLYSTIGTSTVLSAKLRLTITDNGNNWGSTGRTVDLHRLIVSWDEGNGTENDRGTSTGVTWNCASDSNIQNILKNCSGTNEWEMGQSNVHPWTQTATDSKTIMNYQSGVVEYDVTMDIVSFINGTNNNYGWIIKKTNEGQFGQVSFGTKESTSVPQLVVTYQP